MSNSRQIMNKPLKALYLSERLLSGNEAPDLYVATCWHGLVTAGDGVIWFHTVCAIRGGNLHEIKQCEIEE